MNIVNVTETNNTVSVDETTNTVTINEGSPTVISVITEGPQGPIGTAIDSSNKVDGSIIYYDSTSATFKADATTTKLTLVNGGNF